MFFNSVPVYEYEPPRVVNFLCLPDICLSHLYTGIDVGYDGWEDDPDPQQLVPSDGLLMLMCGESSQCDSNQICINGVCALKCITNDDCASFQVGEINV